MPRSLRPSQSPAKSKEYYDRAKPRKQVEWNARSAAYRANNLELCRARCRNAHYKRKYGITFYEWETMFKVQGCVCASCGRDTPSDKLKATGKTRGHGWHTDHNHETGAVRGILCFRCNIGIGYLEDRTFRANAEKYLEKTDV